jgi:hypothetical protein
MSYYLVEKRDHLAVHCIFDSLERAVQFLAITVPIYCERGYYMDKTLTADDFEIICK